ncbi:MAG: putative orfan [Satyrvirus sp.]|uniref:Putative orfan n=1 Tax=Satyrvirus sp. TaxID=2487771 RepID=A0A3G5AFR4_9VIRU|nr:MAG: putative orfan [Satyrvirus sp.]
MDYKLADFCIGKTTTNINIWYVPKKNLVDKIYDYLFGAEEKVSTYCPYCVENECVPPLGVCKLEDINMTENKYCCECPYQDSHPKPVKLTCPKCYVFAITNCVMIPEDITKCTNCKNEIDGYQLCAICSNILKKCCKCGNNFQNGDNYISEIDIKMANKIEEKNRILDKMDEHVREAQSSIFISSLNYLDGLSKKVKILIAGKNEDEVKNIMAGLC